MLGATKPESRSCPAVFSDRVAASFAGFVGGAVSAAEVQRGRSPFADRLGEEIASPQLRIADDGTDPGERVTPPVVELFDAGINLTRGRLVLPRHALLGPDFAGP